MSSSMIIANELSPNESATASCPTPLSLAISAHSLIQDVPSFIAALRMLSAEVSHASPFPSPESAQGQTIHATCGLPLSKPSALYDRDSHSWKMCQGWLLADISEPSWETWPKAGMVSGGAFYPQPSWERPIGEIGYGLLPTPTTSDTSDREPGTPILTKNGTVRHRNKAGGQSYMRLTQVVKYWATPQSRDYRTGEAHRWDNPNKSRNLNDQVAKWPTPTARDSTSRGPSEATRNTPALNHVATEGNGGKLNPTWVELLMGWPLDWTSLNPIDVVQYRQWLMGFKGENNAQIATRPREVLRVLRKEVGEEALQRQDGGYASVPAEDALRQDMRQQPSEVDQAWLQLESAQAFEEELRSVWMGQETPGAPLGSEHREQRAGEHTDPMQAMPRLLAHYGQEAWKDGSWENAIPRTVDGIAFRVERIRAIGNGQVPICAALAFLLLAGGES